MLQQKRAPVQKRHTASNGAVQYSNVHNIANLECAITPKLKWAMSQNFDFPPTQNLNASNIVKQ